MSNYWAERFIEEEKRVNDLATDEIRRQQLQYEKSLAKINRDIEVWYGRIAKNNEVSLAEAKQLLNAKELKEFKWTLEEYIKYGKENGISGDWSKQLENASARVHIERLEALKLQVRGQIEKLYNGRESGFESYLKNIYEDQYNHTAFQIAKGTSVGTNLYKLNDKLVGEVIKKPWAPDGKNFSERIWGDKNRLINTLHTELTQGFIRGDSIKEMTDNISKKMNVSKANAERLVRTESAAYASKARQQSFIDLDVEKFEVVATLDTRTSEICQHLDGKIFDMKDYEIGVTAPPYHINCRSTTAPYFEDEEEDTRTARNIEIGKTEYVPANMKYKEWREKYLKDRVEKEGKSGIIQLKGNIYEKDLLEYIIETIGENNTDNRKELAKLVLEKQESDIEIVIKDMNSRGSCSFKISDDEIIEIASLNLQKNDERDIKYQIKTIFHEAYHAKMNGMKTDLKILGRDEFFKIEETFTECTSHYIIKELDVAKDLMPAYPNYLTETLPKLKKIKEFKNCKTIEEFGEIMFDYRYGDKKTAEWTTVHNALKNISFDKIEYFKKYSDYIEDNIDLIIDKIQENALIVKEVREQFKEELKKILANPEKIDGINSKMVFDNSLMAAMRLKGVE